MTLARQIAQGLTLDSMIRRILVVEDNEDDERLTLRAIQQAALKVNVRIARTGEQACAELFDGADAPALVLLDLDLPDMSGLDILKRMRGHMATKFVPVVVFSSTSDESKICRCFQLSANSFIQKPINPDLYDSALKVMLYYWLAVHHPLASFTHPGLRGAGWSDLSPNFSRP